MVGQITPGRMKRKQQIPSAPQKKKNWKEDLTGQHYNPQRFITLRPRPSN
jgi:hypothetical protein